MISEWPVILLAFAVVALPALVGKSGAAVFSLGILGFVLAVGAVFAGRIVLIAVSALVFLTQVLVALEPGSASGWWIIVYSAGFFIYLDAGSGVVERRNRLPGAFGRQISRIGVLTLLVTCISAIVLVFARAPIEHGILVQAAGLGAAATLVLVVAQLARGGARE
ncbi:MAG: hypothetical protein OEX97_09245 [Acidimicrobiia bacterium]|nr:hypothetical protein [Acidimicrobiia bacterium]